MRQLAVAGTLLLACMLGFAPSAYARNRYTATARAAARFESMPAASLRMRTHWSARRSRQFQVSATARALSILPRNASMANIVLAAARRHGVPAALAYGVASVESGFNPHARSRSGAVGLMQILPKTARGLGCRGSLANPVANAECGARYLASILHAHRGNMRVAAAMYNHGPYARRISRGAARYAALVMRRARKAA